MPSMEDVSVREYNKQVKLVTKLCVELELASKKIETLKKRSKDQRSRHLLELETMQIQWKNEAQKRLDKIVRENEQKVQELRQINDTIKRDNEHLRLILKKNAKIQGNLANVEEHVYDGAYVRLVAG